MSATVGGPTAPLGTTNPTALFLLEAQGPLVDALTSHEVLTEAAGRLGSLGSSLWEAAYKELAGMLRGFLDVDVGATVVAGWCAHRDLVKAGRETLTTPAAVLVPLTGRDLSLAKRPAVEVLLGNTVLTRLQFELRVDVHVDTASAVVRGGRLVELTTGTCHVKVTLTCEGSELKSAKHDFDPRLALSLRDGLPLVAVPTQR